MSRREKLCKIIRNLILENKDVNGTIKKKNVYHYIVCNDPDILIYYIND